MSPPPRLLFITSTRIGDAVLSTGLLRHLIAEMNGPRVTIAAGPAAAPLFEGVPGLERIIPVSKARHGRHWLTLWGQVAPHLWHTVVDLRRSALAWTLLARRRLVLGREDCDSHRVRHIASVAGLAEAPPSPHLWTRPEDEAAATTLLGPEDGRPLLGLGPTANWRGKVWRAGRFAELVERLTAPTGLLPGARVAVFGGPGEQEQAAPVLAAVPAERRLDLVGTVPLLTAACVLRRCALYIGNDSALMHMAAAVGTPTLGLFGPSRENHYAPWGHRAAAVRTDLAYDDLFPPGYNHLTTETLMDSLPVGKVEAAARALWHRCCEDGPRP